MISKGLMDAENGIPEGFKGGLSPSRSRICASRDSGVSRCPNFVREETQQVNSGKETEHNAKLKP